MINEETKEIMREHENSRDVARNYSEANGEFSRKGKFGRSIMLVKTSFKVLMMDKEIALFPIFSTIASLLVLLSFALPFYKIGVFDENASVDSVLFYSILFAFYLVNYFVITFFNVGLVTCAQIRLDGGDPTFKNGIDNAMKHKGRIFVWALVSATVGMILRIIADRSKWLGKLVASLIGLVWTLATYFIVPVLIFEEKDIRASIKASSELFRKTWGENFISNISMTIAFIPFVLLAIVPVVLAAIAQSPLGLIVALIFMVLSFLLIGIVSSSIKGIFDVALYNYAKSGTISAFFSKEMMTEAFVPKKK